MVFPGKSYYGIDRYHKLSMLTMRIKRDTGILTQKAIIFM